VRNKHAKCAKQAKRSKLESSVGGLHGEPGIQ